VSLADDWDDQMPEQDPDYAYEAHLADQDEEQAPETWPPLPVDLPIEPNPDAPF
jgi:hypothetical protein